MVLTTRCLRFLVLTKTCALVLPDLLVSFRKNMMQRLSIGVVKKVHYSKANADFRDF